MSNIIVKPLQTEKSTMLQERRNQYGFIVAKSANKLEIKKAIEALYNVEVESVNTANYGGGKKKMKYTSKGVSYERNKMYKKAVVSLAEGDTIAIYDNI